MVRGKQAWKCSPRAFTTIKDFEGDDLDSLIEAHGRYAKTKELEARSNLVRSINAEKRWIVCGCNAIKGRGPFMYPKSNGVIQREADGAGTPHVDGCPFQRTHQSQIRLLGTYRSLRPSVANPANLRLLGGFAVPANRAESVQHRQESSHRSRSSLARLLFDLLHVAGIDRMSGCWNDRTLSDQQARMQAAAGAFHLSRDTSMVDWFATTLSEFRELTERVARAPNDWVGTRPHGIFIGTFGSIEGDFLMPTRPEIPPIEVKGSLSVWGESKKRERAPYLVVCVVAKSLPTDKDAVVMRAYAHPCLSWKSLLPVDSKAERDTFKVLEACASWLRRNTGIQTTLWKPMFDVGPDNGLARPVCIPDFVLESTGHGVVHPRVIIETMGSTKDDYVARKKRMRPYFEKVGHHGLNMRSNPVIEDARSIGPNGDEATDRLWRSVHDAIRGRGDFEIEG